ncbi:universal stress protein [Acinetobacter sp. MD2]|uniref:universal stress protein n=1 Tax=Acinetobacter sp. MD2 TaxID=2600066 RepID=UPI002D1EC9F5|nr:universal stress protein [Acinetobacter sp. MD2]MEB3767946.1 universal stress protein [Acinetobacter sp. MD2]
MNYQHILVAIDSTATAHQLLDHIKGIATSLHSKITVAQVLKLDPITAREYVQTGESNLFIDRARQEILATLSEIQNHYVSSELPIEILLLEGFSIADTITQAATDLNADLMVIGSHGYTGLSKLILGSISQKVLNKTALPVLIVH